MACIKRAFTQNPVHEETNNSQRGVFHPWFDDELLCDSSHGNLLDHDYDKSDHYDPADVDSIYDHDGQANVDLPLIWGSGGLIHLSASVAAKVNEKEYIMKKLILMPLLVAVSATLLASCASDQPATTTTTTTHETTVTQPATTQTTQVRTYH